VPLRRRKEKERRISFDRYAILASLGPTACRDLTLEFKVTFGAYDDHGEAVRVLHAENLLVEDFELVERLARVDRVDEQEALAIFHLLLSQNVV
jgi:hypothetical protein